MTDIEREPTESEALSELSKGEDATSYIDQRNEDEAGERIESEAEATVRKLQEKTPELKEARKVGRAQRYKIARDKYKAEAEELRSRLGQSAEQEPEPRDYEKFEPNAPTDAPSVDPVAEARLENSLEAAKILHGGDKLQAAYEAFIEYAHATRDEASYRRIMDSADPGMELVQWHAEQGYPVASPEALAAAQQQGREQQEFQQQLQARDRQIRQQAELDLRIEAYSKENPRFHQALADGMWIYEHINAPKFGELVRSSPVAPEILYLLATDLENDFGLVGQLEAIQGDEIAQARMAGALEQVVYSQRRSASSPQMPRATRAPAPLAPVRGGASAPRDLHSLAKSESAEDYIKARRSAR